MFLFLSFFLSFVSASTSTAQEQLNFFARTLGHFLHNDIQTDTSLTNKHKIENLSLKELLSSIPELDDICLPRSLSKEIVRTVMRLCQISPLPPDRALKSLTFQKSGETHLSMRTWRKKGILQELGVSSLLRCHQNNRERTGGELRQLRNWMVEPDCSFNTDKVTANNCAKGFSFLENLQCFRE